MNRLLKISLQCPTTGRTVELQTREWHVEVDGENEVIHYRTDCICGAEHFGFMTQRFAALHASVEV